MKKQQTERKVLLNFEVPEALRDAIRLYCAQNKITVRLFLNSCIKEKMRRDNIATQLLDTPDIPYVAIDADDPCGLQCLKVSE